MLNDNKLPLDNVLNYISKGVINTQKDNDQLLSWALSAFNKLNYQNLKYVDDIDFFNVENHQTIVLPPHIKNIDEVKILVDNTDLYTTTGQEDYSDTVYFQSFLENDDCWMRLEEIEPKQVGYYCSISNQQLVYSITHVSKSSRVIQTPYKTATLMVKYNRLLKDGESNFLLPEEPEVFWEYLGASVEMKHFKERMHMSEAGAGQMFQESQERAANYLTSARRKIAHANFSISLHKNVIFGDSKIVGSFASITDRYHKNLY